MVIRADGIPRSFRITATEEKSLEVGNLSAFLYDLVLLHDRMLMSVSEKYDYRYPTYYFYSRNSRKRIEKSDRLQVKIIKRESPISLVLDIPAAIETAIFALLLIKILRESVGVIRDRKAHEINMALQEERLDTAKIGKEAAEIDRKNKILDSRIKRSQLQSTKADIYEVVGRHLEPHLSQKDSKEADQIKRDVSNDMARLLDNEQINIDTIEDIDN